MTTILKTKDNQVIDLDDVTEVHLLEKEYDFPHWIWFVLWGILLLPIGFIFPLIIGLTRRQYVVAIKFKKSKRLYTVNKKNWRLLQAHDLDAISGF